MIPGRLDPDSGSVLWARRGWEASLDVVTVHGSGVLLAWCHPLSDGDQPVVWMVTADAARGLAWLLRSEVDGRLEFITPGEARGALTTAEVEVGDGGRLRIELSTGGEAFAVVMRAGEADRLADTLDDAALLCHGPMPVEVTQAWDALAYAMLAAGAIGLSRSYLLSALMAQLLAEPAVEPAA